MLGQERDEGQRGGEREGGCIGIGGKEDVICLCLDLDLGSDVCMSWVFSHFLPFLYCYFVLFSSSRCN